MEIVNKLAEVKKEIKAMVKYSEDAKVLVRIYEDDENGFDEYCVEITVDDEGEREYWITEIFEDAKAGMKRAKAVHRTISKWFENSDEVNVEKGIRTYNNASD